MIVIDSLKAAHMLIAFNSLSFLPPSLPPLFPTPPVKHLLKSGDAQQEVAESAHSSFI